MVRIQAVGGPTAILEVGGLRLLTDPTFDPPGDYPRPDGPTLVKLAPPALGPDDLGRVDAVLLSHDQHADNLDRSGRAYLARVPVTLTTPSGSARLTGDWAAAGPAGNGQPAEPDGQPRAQGLAPWHQVDLPRPDGGTLRVTAVPARHGPEGCEPVSGEVTGFVLTAADLPTIYVSG
ncbi:MAG TPA: MBL fold metallo-hydrolase, partial [Trebonia sp.]|nr:MBL fold metallo-hydrolase [Trebonia sp.]